MMAQKPHGRNSARRPLHHHHRRVVLVLLPAQVAAPIYEQRIQDLGGGAVTEGTEELPRMLVAVEVLPGVRGFEETVRAEDEAAARRDLEAEVGVRAGRALAERQSG